MNTPTDLILTCGAVNQRPAVHTMLPRLISELQLEDQVIPANISGREVITTVIPQGYRCALLIARAKSTKLVPEMFAGLEYGFPILNLSASDSYIAHEILENPNFPVISAQSSKMVTDIVTWFAVGYCSAAQIQSDVFQSGRYPPTTVRPSIAGCTWSIFGKGQQAIDMISELSVKRAGKIIVWNPQFNEFDNARLRAALLPGSPTKLELTTDLDLACDCEFASLHVPPDTRPYRESGFITWEMFDLNLLRQFRNVVMINVSRGDLMVEDAVIEALDQGNIQAYYSDVINSEAEASRRMKHSALWRAFHREDFARDRLLLTPHIGNETDEFEQLCEDLIEVQLRLLATSRSAQKN